ncbi:hypothetical protein ACEYYB_06655 [Paracoccus sp. p4-l81]|uniref:capsular polysaccharide export protein, LipB/KpsS family n=1 Tax=Paracoccus sp. p4-l81 TaxID=3342806 RepID=UPI0035B7D150
MNILLLSNNAPNYFHFFNEIARLLMRDGDKVVVAADSNFARAENGLDQVGFSEVISFQDFFADHETDHAILQRYGDLNLNAALLSDFERDAAYNVWGANPGMDFFDRIKSGLLTFYEQIFTRHQIDVVIYENVASTQTHFALFVAQRMGVRYVGLAGSRLPGRFGVTDDPMRDFETKRQFDLIRSGQAPLSDDLRAWAGDYIGTLETAVPDYMKFNKMERVAILSRYVRLHRLKKLRSLLRHIGDSRTGTVTLGNPLRTHVNLMRRNIARRLKLRRIQRFYEKPRPGEDFLLYPLHFHPEASTSVMCGTYLDEYEVIRNIAFNLPEGLRLYVKDHVTAFGFPSLDFYRRVARLPNVRLLGPNEPTKQLIRESRAVITLTSTVGYEALLLKKRVILYGSVFYDFHTGITKLRDPSALHGLIRQVVETPADWDDDYNVDFVSAYHRATLPASLNLMLDGEAAKAEARKIYPLLRDAGYFSRA